MSGCCLSKQRRQRKKVNIVVVVNGKTQRRRHLRIVRFNNPKATTIIHGKDELMRNEILPARQAYKYNDREQVRGRILC